METTKLYVPLTDSEFEALRAAANKEFREPRQQARRIIAAALTERNSETIRTELISQDAFAELDSARRHYPDWPIDIVHASAIMVEEAGEVLKVANNLRWHQKDSDLSEFRKEVVQTIAMCFRLLLDTPLQEKEENA